MNLSRKDREELNSLSKEVFGTSSRWQKLVDQGYMKPLTKKVSETVPGAKEGDPATETEIEVLDTREDGAVQMTTARHTLESIKEYMLSRKKQFDLIRAEMKRKKDQEELAKRVHSELNGSAI